MDRRAAVADREPASAGDSSGHAEEARLRTARFAAAEVKSAIFGMNSARLYGIEPTAYANLDDGLAKLKRAYRAAGGVRSNLRYGYVTCA